MLVGQLQHPVGEGGREQQVQAALGIGQAAQQEADVLDEAEVEHAVGLVEHHDLGVAQVEHVLLEIVDDPARRADQDVHARLQRAALLVVVHAAESEAEREPGVLAEQFRILVDLDRELAGRREHQRARRGDRPVRRRRVAQQVREQRDQEGRGLAGAGLRLARDVEAGERARQRLRLDRRASFEAGIGYSAGDGLGQVQAGEGEVGILLGHRTSIMTVIT